MSAVAPPPFLLGVLGGMGPLATLDFLKKLIEATPADGDADHVPVVVASIPQIPPRVAAIVADGDSPFPALVDARDRLIAAGATTLVMPCNTAHHWHAALAAGLDVPFLHLGEAAIAEVGDCLAPPARIGVIATEATRAIRLYSTPLGRAGYAVVEPDAAAAREVARGIAEVKRGAVAAGGARFSEAVRSLAAAGAQAVVLGCTEVPPGLAAQSMPPAVPVIDPTAALARRCAGLWARARPAGPSDR